MSSQPYDLESLLGRALSPVEPPEHLTARMEETFTTITSLAADEIDNWELTALHDPRTWARPAAAIAIGTAAAGAAAVLQGRKRRGKRHPSDADPVDFAATALRTIADEVERRVRR